MKATLLLLSFYFFSFSAVATDFPVGSFSCKAGRFNYLITVAKANLAGFDLPVVTITNAGDHQQGYGIGHVVTDSAAGTTTIQYDQRTQIGFDAGGKLIYVNDRCE